MVKGKVFRGEIWMVELKESYPYMLKNLHPCIILSNFRCLEKSPLLQVVPISSKPKSQPFHIEIEGYGLDCKSIILIEQLQTVGRDALKYCIGKVTSSILLEVRKKLDIQLGFDNNYKIEMFEKIKEMLDELRELDRYLNENYNKDTLEERKLLIKDLENYCINHCIQISLDKYLKNEGEIKNAKAI